MVCCNNIADTYPTKDIADYLFTVHGGIWGWASWKRFYGLSDSTYSWLENEVTKQTIVNNFYTKGNEKLI